jgi:hypothetical protein
MEDDVFEASLLKLCREALVGERLILLPLALFAFRRAIAVEARRYCARAPEARRAARFFYPVD